MDGEGQVGEFLAVLAGAAILTAALTYPLAFRPCILPVRAS